MQVPAPLSTATFTIFDRILTLWTCVSQQCANDTSSWKAFTCHLPDSTATYSKTLAANAVSTTPNQSSSGSFQCAQQEPAADEEHSWGATNGTWGASQADDAGLQGQDAFDFSDLESALSNAVQLASTNSSQQHDRDISKPMHSQEQREHKHASSCCLATDASKYSLPGFYLHMTANPSGTSASLSAEEQHIADLVAAYQNETKQVQIMSDFSCNHLVFMSMGTPDWRPLDKLSTASTLHPRQTWHRCVANYRLVRQRIWQLPVTNMSGLERHMRKTRRVHLTNSVCLCSIFHSSASDTGVLTAPPYLVQAHV